MGQKNKKILLVEDIDRMRQRNILGGRIYDYKNLPHIEWGHCFIQLLIPYSCWLSRITKKGVLQHLLLKILLNGYVGILGRKLLCSFVIKLAAMMFHNHRNAQTDYIRAME